jgi:hypothetical protein
MRYMCICLYMSGFICVCAFVCIYTIRLIKIQFNLFNYTNNIS